MRFAAYDVWLGLPPGTSGTPVNRYTRQFLAGPLGTALTVHTTLDLNDLNRQLATSSPSDLIAWARDTFAGGLAMTSSFGAQSAVMLHLVTAVVPDIRVVWIDTGYLFPETYRFAQSLKERLNLNLQVFSASMTAARFEAIHGKRWEEGGEGIDAYHKVFKIEPMQRAVKELGITCWLAGLRADQTDHRATLRQVELQNGIYKVHPILKWTARDVGLYLEKHDLPYHPLVEQGYASIGDVHSSRKALDEAGERGSRFSGLRQECGLHLPTTEDENASRESSGL